MKMVVYFAIRQAWHYVNNTCNKFCSFGNCRIFSVLTAIVPGEPGLAGFIEAKDDGSSGDNGSYRTCKALVKSLPTNQHPL